MFQDEDYESDQEIQFMYSSKHFSEQKVEKQNVGSSGMDFNHLTGEGESLLKMMKERGLDLTDNELKKIRDRREFKSKDKQSSKPKAKAGFLDSGNSATLQQLLKSLNKALSKADPQQASCVLSYILQIKGLSAEDNNKFGIMKANLLFGLGAYQQCLAKSSQLMENPLNHLSGAIFSNLIAKSKAQLNQVFEGYFDLLRAKSLIHEYRQSLTINTQKLPQTQDQDFKDSELDITTRQINHTQLQYNIKLSEIKNSTSLIHPHFPQFRQRNVIQVACGDYHALFLIGTPFTTTTNITNNWSNQVFGIGENTVGQITGKSTQISIKDPQLIWQLSGKGIEGIWASKQSSLAYDQKGNIYEWGVKTIRNQKIDITFKVGQKIKHLEKGYQHYALLGQSKTFYTWGVIGYKQMEIWKEEKPKISLKNIEGFSCGNGHVIAWDTNGNSFGLGNNEYGQLGLEGEKYTKQYKEIDKIQIMGNIKKSYCLGDLTFFVNVDEEVFYCGKYSYNKNPQLRIKQAEFYQEPKHVIQISGTIGNYYITDQNGCLQRWDVDSTVKFKLNSDEKVTQRYIVNTRQNVDYHRGITYRIKSLLQPKLCEVKQITQNPNTFQLIEFIVHLRDKLGPYGNEFILPVRCQIFLSTYKANIPDLIVENKNYLQSLDKVKDEKNIIVGEIVESRLIEFSLQRLQEEKESCKLSIQAQRAGRYYFYVFLEEELVYNKQLVIQVSARERQLESQTKLDRELKEEQRRKKAELQKQRLLDEKKKKEEDEQQRRRQTQRRAQETLKKHMKEQEEERLRVEQQRKRKLELITGGGFDLSKLKKSSMLQKTGESFLPDINIRPSSKRKVGLPKPTELISGSSKIEKPFNEISISSSYTSGFQSEKVEKKEKSKAKIVQNIANITTNNTVFSTGRPIVKRGLSKGNKN